MSSNKLNYILIFSCQPSDKTMAESPFAKDFVFHLDKWEEENEGLVLPTALQHFQYEIVSLTIKGIRLSGEEQTPDQYRLEVEAQDKLEQHEKIQAF